MDRLNEVKEIVASSLHRKLQSKRRNEHKKRLESGELFSSLPEVQIPEIFSKIQKTYWDCLKSVEDPRESTKVVYPLYKILHRILSGLMGGSIYVGVLFPNIQEKASKKKGEHILGALPTKKTVYLLLQRINWTKANVALAPLWKVLGYTPDLVVNRKSRTTKEILEEFVEEEVVEKRQKQLGQNSLRALRNQREKYQGLSASEAKKGRRSRKKNQSAIRQS